MVKRIVILGGGTGGTLMANRLRKTYGQSEVEIAVVDRDGASSRTASRSTRPRSTTSPSPTIWCTSQTEPCFHTTC